MTKYYIGRTLPLEIMELLGPFFFQYLSPTLGNMVIETTKKKKNKEIIRNKMRKNIIFSSALIFLLHPWHGIQNI